MAGVSVDRINLQHRDRPMRKLNSFALAGLMLGAGLLAAGSASAHASLVKSTPGANATVASPKAIALTFNEELAPAFSKFDVSMADGMKVTVKSAVSKNRLSMTGAPQGKLAPGAYMINWHAAAADDGHRTNGTVRFTVK